MSTETNFNILEQLQAPKPSNFPLDEFLGNGNNIKTIESCEVPISERRKKDPSVTLMKKITELTGEADRIVKACETQLEPVLQSISTSSSSFTESGSSYTEHLVEKKFKEVTFKKIKAKDSTGFSSGIVNSKKQMPVSHAYSPKQFEENITRHSQMLSKSVQKSYCYIPPARVINRSPKPSLSAASEKTRTTPSSTAFHSGNQSNRLRSPSINEKKYYHNGSPPSKLVSTKESSHYPKVRPTQPDKIRKTNDVKHTFVEMSEASSRVKGPGGEKNHLTKSSYEEITSIASVWNKEYSDACVNTDLIKKNNASLVKVISEKEVRTSVEESRLYQIQQLPTVNIRPNLTRQIGPIIDIKVSKPIVTKANVAVIECFHSDVNENRPSNRINRTENEEKSEALRDSVQTTMKEAKNELKLQKCIRELLKKLNLKKGQDFSKLRESLNTLLMLLDQITSGNTAPFRMTEKTIVDESINLFFANADVVTELLENELKNSKDTFCKYPEYIIKAVNILSSNIRSNFVVKERQRTFVKSSINHSSFENNKKHENEERLGLSKSRKGKPRIKDDDISVYSNKTSTSESSFSKRNGVELPKELYIPYRKLVPGGKYKFMEEVNNSKELELRRKRLETINKINQTLKAELPFDESSTSEKEGKQSQVDVNERLNQTFIIMGRSDEEEEEKLNYKTDTEALKKSDIEYEEDWEQELEASGADSGPAFKTVEVKADVHRYDGHSDKGPTQIGNMDDSSNVGKNISKRKNSEEPKIFVTTAVQTGMHYENPLLDKNTFPSDTETSREQIGKQQLDNVSKTTMSEGLSFPVLRMTNPITKSLLEVRFPEQTDKIQSSILVEKSANKEEIKLLYNINNEEKVHTWPRSTKNKEPTITKKPEVSSNNSFSDSNVNTKVVQEKDIEPMRNSSDFQHITTNFIGFLESKVTEMVSKFKSSEICSEKLLPDKVRHDRHKDSRYFTYANSFNQLNPSMRENKTIYKSVSSLVSDKSTDELKFHKNLVSRGCSPENERMKFENLISPPLGLKFKHDAIVQTDKEVLLDARVGSLQNNLDSQYTYKIVENIGHTNDPGNASKKDSEKSARHLDESNAIKIDKTFCLTNTTLDINNEALSQSRLLPLPEDVLKEEKEMTMRGKDSLGSNLKEIDEIIPEELFFQINEQAISSGNEQCAPRQATDSLSMIVEDHVYLKESATASRMADTENEVVEETAILHHKTLEVSKIEEDGDSQRTSQILNVLSMTDIGHDFLSPKRQRDFISALSTEKSNKVKQKENATSFSQSTSKANPCSQTVNTFFKNRSLKNLNPHPAELNIQLKLPECSDIKNDHNKENVHSLHECGSAEPEAVLSSFDSGNRSHVQNCAFEPACNRPPLRETLESEQPDHENLLMSKNIQTPIIINRVVEDSDCINLQRDATTQLPGYMADSDNSSALSEECIPIHYFHSDDMSDGEVRFVYTSNSYSSGEIKPIDQLHGSDRVTTQQTLRKDLNISSPLDERAVGTSQPINSTGCLTLKCDVNDRVDNTTEKNVRVETTPELIYEESCSITESLSTGELRQILSSDDKLDDGIISKLFEIHLQCSGQTSSDSPDVFDKNYSPKEYVFTESTNNNTAKD